MRPAALMLLCAAGALCACSAFDVDEQIDAAPPSGAAGKLVPPAPRTGDASGSAVAVSGDTIAVGVPGRDVSDGGGNTVLSDAGEVFVYRESGAVLTLEAEIFAPDPRAGDAFGDAVSLDGDLLVVGAPGVDDAGADTGATYLFERSGTEWTQVEVQAN